MTITRKQYGNTLEVAVDDRLDSVTSPDLDAALKESLDGVEELILDLGRLDNISSAGLRVLLATHEVMSEKGTMKIINANEMVKEVFHVTGVGSILTVE